MRLMKAAVFSPRHWAGRNRQKTSWLLLALSLAACQTPAVQTRTVEVKIPVSVQSIKPAQVPAVPTPLPPRPSSLSAAADVLASKWCEAVSYFLKVDPLLRVSAGQQPNALPTYPECERR